MRSLFRVGGVYLTLGALVLISRLWADTKQPVAPRTRIALVNLAYVIKHYDKAKAFQDALREESKSSDKRAKEMQARIDELTKELTDKPDLPADKREAIERRVTKMNRELEDFSDEARRSWNKKNDKAMVTLYGEVRQAVERHAKAHALELVLQFNDAAEEAEGNSPATIARRLQAPGCLPLYAAQGMDISKEILAALNNKPRENNGGD